MQLREALTTIQEFSSAELPLCRVLLVTGFNPLHLQTFFHAYLQRSLPGHRVAVSTGLYDDFAGTLARIETSAADMLAIAIEWADLDRRLGFRHLGGWGPKELPDIVSGAQASLVAFRTGLEALSDHVPIAVSLPTLDLPPVFQAPSWQLGEAEICLWRAVDDFAGWAVARRNVHVAKVERATSPPAFDFKGELLAGLPYTMPHAERMGRTLAQLLVPPVPKKGLITDLDETLWAGIAGEVGPERVSWDLANKTQAHGLYQQLLRALADQGVLIGVASKNDPETVEAVLRRPDVLLPPEYLFPIEAHWSPKPESVAKILDTWNIHPESVVFVDDSASEIAEVKAAFPDIECVCFDAQNYEGTRSLLYRLRDLFAKQTYAEEDDVRRESIRAGQLFREHEAKSGAAHEAFLRDSQPRIVLDFANGANPRSLDLVNKTNQFNLNGIRYTEGEWCKKLALPQAFVVTASYSDKYGPLGIIAVLAGQAGSSELTVSTWVMSCRAFGRRIEHQCLKALLDRYGAREASLEFSPTPRNLCLQEFLESVTGEKPEGAVRISRAFFLERCPLLYHQAEIRHE